MTDYADKTELLIELAEGKLSARRAKELRAEIRSDHELAETYEMVQQLLALREANRTAADSPAPRSLARRLYRDFLKDRGDSECSHGVLVYDSRGLPLPRGVRPAAVDTRELRYKLGDVEVEIALYPITPESFEMIGQIMGLPEGRRCSVRLHGGRSRQSTDADSQQLFRFARVQSADYVLTVKDATQVLGVIELSL